MRSDIMNNINKSTGLKLILLHIQYGIKSMKYSRFKVIMALVMMMCLLCCILKFSVFCSSIHNMFANYDNMFLYFLSLNCIKIILGFLIAFTPLTMLYIYGTPFQTYQHRKGFRVIGLVNHAQEPPELLQKEIKDEYVFFEYYTSGLSLKAFQDMNEKLEAALNLSIIEIYQGNNKRKIIIKGIKGSQQLPDFIKWSDEYLLKDDSKAILGKALNGNKIIDFNVTPHVQCGGQTGSGKTILLSCVLYQLFISGATIYLVDFKGFLDFPGIMREMYYCVDTKEQLLQLTDYLLNVMEQRKLLFRSKNCSNILEFNKKFPEEKCCHIYLASDEIAFAFQKKGLNKQDKELVEQIEKNMSLLAQQSRFAGIHLWLSTQRGDADTIPPQVRSNLTFRICGRGNEILSRVTIDSSLAKEIPAGLKGRFVDDNEEFFQAFYFEGIENEG